MKEFVFIIIGFVLLIKAAEYFVDASTDIAKIFKISEIVIGATIVSIGTTLPETMVSATSAFKGHGDIAYGNAIGSIICNTALISGIALSFSPSDVSRKALKAPVLFFFCTFIFYVLNATVFGGFSRVAGIILISIFIVYVIYVVHSNQNNNKKLQDENSNEIQTEIKDDKNKILKAIVILVISAAVIAFASNLLVDNGTAIAKKFGVPEAVIGLTLIALGTSLPELSTAITAIVKGHSNLSLGNIIGANFFNLVLVTGISVTIHPFKIPSDKTLFGVNSSLIVDIPVAFIVMIILCIPSIINNKTKRWQGILLIFIYILFIYYQFKI